jgi:biopolymer transport protein ExbD
MATATQRQLDVWILEVNTVYRQVPFAVVTDWLQQGRLLPDDRVRLTGSQKWHPIRVVPAFAPYVPRAAPLRADDTAEALEPVELGLDWRRPGEEDDDDVDMIPLIDISLVLLIFFMMTASVGGGILSGITTPQATHQLSQIAKGTYWVGIDTKSQGGAVEKDEAGRPLPWYSFGKDTSQRVPPTRDLNEVLGALAKEVQPVEGAEVRVRIRAERSLPVEAVKGVTLELQGLEARLNRERGAGKGKLLFTIQGEVSEPKGR